MSYEPVRVASIGLGRWANIMANAIERSEKLKIVACYSRSAEKRKAFAAKHNCEIEESLDALLKRDDIEGVIVTTPNDQHAPVIEAAAAAGKHVYVDKPIAVSLDHARRIEKAVREAGVVFTVGHSARRLAGVRKIKELMENGRIGEVSMIETNFSNERGLELQPGNWRGDRKMAPGGPLTQLAVHHVDSLQYLLGPVVRVFSFMKSMYTPVDQDTATMTICEFASGKLAYVGANWASPGVFFMNVYATKATLFYDLDFGWWSKADVVDDHSKLILREFTSKGDDPDNRFLHDVPVTLQRGDMFREQFEDFADAIRGLKAAPEIDAAQAIHNLAVVLAAVESSKTGRAVEIKDILES
ncbi:1,5-anhydro-D-fructose reductase [Moorella humiferrea]|uniref:Gfo/Idh/MocA family protein n=1 Tax=Neomoorella humiferrea TaxID=676965 RepID=UPI0030CC17C7